MKKLLTLGFALSILTLAGCANSQPTEEEVVAPVAEEMPAVVEETPVADMATGTTEVAPVADVATGTTEVATGN